MFTYPCYKNPNVIEVTAYHYVFLINSSARLSNLCIATCYKLPVAKEARKFQISKTTQ